MQSSSRSNLLRSSLAARASTLFFTRPTMSQSFCQPAKAFSDLWGSRLLRQHADSAGKTAAKRCPLKGKSSWSENHEQGKAGSSPRSVALMTLMGFAVAATEDGPTNGQAGLRVSTNFVKTLIEAVYAGTDSYGSISDDEEEEIVASGAHWAYGEISFEGMQALLARMNLSEDSVFYDLGSGLGKAVTQAFFLSPAKTVVGVEMAVTRHNQAKHSCERLCKILNLLGGQGVPISGTKMGMGSEWLEEEPGSLSPTHILRAYGKEMRLVHADCMLVNTDSASHIFMANLTWPDEIVHKIGRMLDTRSSVVMVASLKKFAEKELRHLKPAGVVYLPMSWQDRNVVSYGVPVYLYGRK